MQVCATDPFADLVLHVLAHVRAPGPTDLYDARYVAWAAARSPDLSRVKVQPDGELLGTAWCERDAQVLRRWMDLHHDLAAFMKTSDRAIADQRPEDVDDAELLAALGQCSPLATELFHAQLGQVAPWFAGLHAVHVAPAVAAATAAVAEHCASAVELAPSLGDARIELAWALGPRAVVSARRILVGVLAPWNGLDAATSAVLALHGDAMRRAMEPDPAAVHWHAHVEVAVAIAGGSPATARLREAHARWLAEIDLAPLCHALARAGTITAAEADALLERPGERAELLCVTG